jgi:pimeloyl-ACP methyl ester carboxylesterase
MRVDVGDGVRLFVDVASSHLVADADEMRERPVLIVMHGGPGVADHSVGRPYFDRFADSHSVVYFDHRGNGRSDERHDPSHWDMDTWADDVWRLCDALELRSPVLLGNSFGGTVAAHAASRCPERPSKLVLMSTNAQSDWPAVFGAFERLGGRTAREAAERFWTDPTAEAMSAYLTECNPLYTQRSPVVAAPRRVWMNLRVLTHFVRNIAPSMDLREGLANVKCPTLVLVGEDDPICPPVMSEVIVSSLPSHLVQFERFTACGHGTYRDQPELTEAVLREFLARSALLPF